MSFDGSTIDVLPSVGSCSKGAAEIRSDFVVMSDDFLTVPAERIKDMKALATYVGGKEVYRDPSYATD